MRKVSDSNEVGKGISPSISDAGDVKEKPKVKVPVLHNLVRISILLLPRSSGEKEEKVKPKKEIPMIERIRQRDEKEE